jgi:hypothetical protein
MSSTNRTLTFVSTYQNPCQISIMYLSTDGNLQTPLVKLLQNEAAILTVTDASDSPYPGPGSSFRAWAANQDNSSNSSYYDGNWGDVVFALYDNSGLGFPNTGGTTPIAFTYPN